jgi:hypothetical protein
MQLYAKNPALVSCKFVAPALFRDRPMPGNRKTLIGAALIGFVEAGSRQGDV